MKESSWNKGPAAANKGLLVELQISNVALNNKNDQDTFNEIII